MLTLGIDFLTALELEPLDFLAVAEEEGCKAVGLSVQAWKPLPFPKPDLVGNPRAVAELARRSADTGVQIHSVELFVMEPGCDIESFRPALAVSAQLGATYLISLAFDGEPARLSDSYGRLCELAREYRLSVLCEVHKRLTLKSIEGAVAFFERAGIDVKLELDSLHFFRHGGKIDEIVKYAHRIGRAQLSDGPASATDEEYDIESRFRRQIPGDGELPLVDFLSALPDGIVIALETPRPDYRTRDRIRRGVAGARALLARARS
ncbi:MAG TPA: TIM barrel protein [Rhizomicrobium sp.]